ncbi:CapA family protein [Thermoleophilia bacterium SCSIO 60948]|nr:CapA family protein [Thermoleophilia bacterium SCSIO 60948]
MSRRTTPAARTAAVLALVLGFGGCSDEQPPAENDEATTGSAQVSTDSATESSRAPEPRRPRVRRISMTFSGDVLIHEPVWERALAFGGGERYAFEPMLAPLRDAIAGADVSICHLETPLVAGEPSGYPLFATPPALADALARTGWDACSTASNHSLDQGVEGIASTTRELDRAGIANAGTSAVPGERSGAAIIRSRGQRIALLSYTTDTNGLPVTEPSSVDIAEADRILADARRARAAGADAVIVNVHWGSGDVPEYVGEPNAAQRELADRLLSSGAVTALVAQGPHVVQPVELRDGRAVVFSTGNLISNQGADSGLPEASRDGAVVRLRLSFQAGERARVTSAGWLPVVTTRPDYVVAPATAEGIRAVDELDPATAAASYERTRSVLEPSEGVSELGSPPR